MTLRRLYRNTMCGTVAAVIAFSTGGCRRQERAFVVGFSQMEHNNPWRLAQTASIKAEAAKRQYDLVVTDAQSQTSKQVSDVEDLVARGVGLILLAPREYEGLAPALEAAQAASIPVILVDREAEGTAGEDYVTFLGSNFIEQGVRAGEWLAGQTAGHARIVELTGTPGSSVAVDRAKGFVQAKGREITAVYAHNDEMALGAIEALKAAGIKPGVDVTIISIDGERAALESIARGELGATVESNPRFGPLAFDVIEKVRRGEKVPPKILITDRFFDRSNAAQFVADAY